VGKNKDGTQRIVGTNTCHWIRLSQVPRGKKITYACTVVAIRTEKGEQKRVRITACGDRLDYPGETSTDTASLDTTKILINSIISTPGARMGAIDISNFYIHKHLIEYQYMRFHISMIPQEIIYEYNLQDIVEDGWCYAENRKAMYIWNKRKWIYRKPRIENSISKSRICSNEIHPRIIHPQNKTNSILFSGG
jgi:hypothetical protein